MEIKTELNNHIEFLRDIIYQGGIMGGNEVDALITELKDLIKKNK